MQIPFPSPPADTCLLYLVRHGATANNLAHPPRLQGYRSDPELSPTGCEEASRVAEFLGRQRMAAVYASPLLRAQETAARIADRQALEVRTLPELTEVDVGNWEEMSWDDIQQQYPEEHRLFMEDPGEHPYHGGETMWQAVERAEPVMRATMQRHLGKAIVMVAHKSINRALMARLIGIPGARIRSIPQSNCAVNVLRLRRDEIEVITINAVFHLAEL